MREKFAIIISATLQREMRLLNNSNGKRGRNLCILALLALLCIGGAELTALYFFNRPLYIQITEPVRQGVRTVQTAAQSAARTIAESATACGSYAAEKLSEFGDACGETWDRLTAPRSSDDPSERQEAGEPELLSDQTITDPAITELEIRDGREVLTGGIVPVVYFNQGEEPWASQLYGSDPISGYGCGPAAMAMAVSSMTETESDPAQMAQWAVKHGHWAKANGSYLSIVGGAAEAFGLTAAPIPEFTVEAIQDALLANHMLVALMGPGHFTKSGHFILLRGTTLSGSILVADPNSKERSLMEWDPQLILDELSSSTANGGPLWVLSDEPLT